jgi:hypothetical protein
MGTIYYVDTEVLAAYLTAKLDGVFKGTFEEWRQAAAEAAELYAGDPWEPEDESSVEGRGSSSG